ncbi:uncharacterized protein LOC119876490 isoform X2 [Canis lupus familiaris]|uniref:uncharacterized protein LOC119876490 isoform X2 n=1 Tax=Canis lupus familiaris TaxID=9615 RepID=UPI0018F4E107|nr:uncharacterized protein LOC119876490 isoform X2 [Canis lupus familiaris]
MGATREGAGLRRPGGLAAAVRPQTRETRTLTRARLALYADFLRPCGALSPPPALSNQSRQIHWGAPEGGARGQPSPAVKASPRLLPDVGARQQQVIPLRWAAANRLCQRAGGCSPVLHHELDGGQGSLLFGCPLQSPCSPGQPQPCLVLLPDGCRGSKLRPSFSPRPGQKASSSEPMLFVV